jgi:hypothetical protein
VTDTAPGQGRFGGDAMGGQDLQTQGPTSVNKSRLFTH